MSSETRKIAPNVLVFLDKAAADFGRMHAERFSQDMWSRLRTLKSPIEDLFFIACVNLCESESIDLNPQLFFLPDASGEMAFRSLTPSPHVFVIPQAPIGKFKVDFLLRSGGVGPSKDLTPVVVELDGHEFHDKDKRQRAYEKSRDRFLVKAGYRVLHFTGGEVVADPYKVAYEALELIGAFIGGRESYDPENPLGIR